MEDERYWFQSTWSHDGLRLAVLIVTLFVLTYHY